MQWSLQSKVRRTQLRFSCAASSWAPTLSATPAAVRLLREHEPVKYTLRFRGGARPLVVHPPVSVARDFIDYPYFADLGAVQLAAALREAGHAVDLVDAYALPGSSLTWRGDGRALLGAPVDEVLARTAATADRPHDVVVVAFTPSTARRARDDVLGALLAGLRRTRPGYAARPRGPLPVGPALRGSRRRRACSRATPRRRLGEVRGRGDRARSWSQALARGERVRAARIAASRSRRSTRSPSPPGISSTCPRTTPSTRASSSTWGAAHGPSPSTVAPFRWSPRAAAPSAAPTAARTPAARRDRPKTQRRLSTARLREHMTALVRTHRRDPPRSPRRAAQRERAPLRRLPRARRRARRRASTCPTGCAPTTSSRATSRR